MGTAHIELMRRLAALEMAHLEWCAATDEFHGYLRGLRKGASDQVAGLEGLQKALDAKYERYRETARLLIHAG